MEDTDLMPFGMHKGKQMQDVPASWLLWFKNEPKSNNFNSDRQAVLDYINYNMDVLKKELQEERNKIKILKNKNRW